VSVSTGEEALARGDACRVPTRVTCEPLDGGNEVVSAGASFCWSGADAETAGGAGLASECDASASREIGDVVRAGGVGAEDAR
jgi:hypothetical protein